jgi:exopolysaccharide production protein ExoZ
MLFYIVTFIAILLFKKKSYLVPTCAAILIIFLLVLYVTFNDLFLDIKYLSRDLTKGIPLLFFVDAFLLLEDKLNKDNKIVKTCLKLGEASYVMCLFYPFIIFFLERVAYPRLFGHPEGFVKQFALMVGAMIFVCVISIVLFKVLDKSIMDFFKKRQKIYVLKAVKS